MTVFAGTTLAIDLSTFEDTPSSTPQRAVVRGRDGRLRAIDIARLAWPDNKSDAGVDHVAELHNGERAGNC